MKATKTAPQIGQVFRFPFIGKAHVVSVHEHDVATLRCGEREFKATFDMLNQVPFKTEDGDRVLEFLGWEHDAPKYGWRQKD